MVVERISDTVKFEDLSNFSANSAAEKQRQATWDLVAGRHNVAVFVKLQDRASGRKFAVHYV